MLGANINEGTRGKQPCAACKHQRKKCRPDACMLYPYFPAHTSQDFIAVHKYFGVGNLVKLIKNLAVEERKRTVQSFVWAARAWKQDPNSGPLGLYMNLAQEYQWTKQENQRLKQEIQELKTAICHGITENLGVGSSVNGNYSALVRVPDVTNFDPMPINYHQGNGLYYDGQGDLDPNFGNVQQRFNPGGMDYQSAGSANQTDSTHNKARGRDVGYAPYNVSDGSWLRQ